MTEIISIDADAMTTVLDSLTRAAEELDSTAGDIPVDVDAGAASSLVSNLIGELIDASIRLIEETATLVELADAALEDLSGFERATSTDISSFTMELR